MVLGRFWRGGTQSECHFSEYHFEATCNMKGKLEEKGNGFHQEDWGGGSSSWIRGDGGLD